MASIESTSKNNHHKNKNNRRNNRNSNQLVNDSWLDIENEDYILDEPNLSEIFQEFWEYRRRRVNSVKSADESHQKLDQSIKNTEPSSSTDHEQTLEEFKEELREKRLARHNAINDLRKKITDLRQQLDEEREITRILRSGQVVRVENVDISISTEDFVVNNSNNSRSLLNQRNDNVGADSDNNGIIGGSDTGQSNLKSQLAEVQLSLQLANADNLSLTTELGVIRKQVSSLKEVIICSKQMIQVREEQVTQLKDKLRQIEESLAEREMKIMSDNLRQEYDRQLANIRNLRQLYEERARVCSAERENLLRQISIKKDELAAEIERNKTLEGRISSFENDLEASNKKINDLQTECREFKFENTHLKDEMAVINKLFSQMLMGFNGNNNLDIDRFTTMLEDNRTLLYEMATREDTSEGASMPRLLFDIVRQANQEDIDPLTATTEVSKASEISEELELQNSIRNQSEINTKVATAQEIVTNLPKVWRVLMELLSHQGIEKVEFKENGESEDCYKSVPASNGTTKSELSVSKTYIKLKDLILEKKSLQKETNKLKTLNTHLERRLNEQEKRMSTVSLELTKTWHLVGKMQRQHRQLHTNEQILRYQLHQKRRLLNELKDELEYCRRKWAAARAKNAESQLQCDDLRREFAKRKLEDLNTSAESGYSDGPGSDDDDIDQTPVKGNLEEIFVCPKKKIERMQSASPTRTPFVDGLYARGQSAPPTATFLAEFTQTVDEMSASFPLQNVAASSIVSERPIATVLETQSGVASVTANTTNNSIADSSSATTSTGTTSSRGAVPKTATRLSRYRTRDTTKPKDEESLEEMFMRISGLPMEPSTENVESQNQAGDGDDTRRNVRAKRIQRLEEQCKSLITQVLETAENREKLEVTFCRYQDELPPAQKPIPLDEYLAGKVTSMDQDPFPETTELLNKATNTADKRDERLKKLEEESKQLMFKLKRTSDRSKRMKSRLERLHDRCTLSREGSTDSVASVEDSQSNVVKSGQVGSTSRASIDKDQDKSLHEGCSKTSIDNALKDNIKEDGATSGADQVSGDKPSSGTLKCDPSVNLTPAEVAYVTKRDERLKRLEEEGKKLLNKLSHTNERGSELSNRLDEIHEQATTKASSPETNPSVSKSNNLKLSGESACAVNKLEEVKRRLEESKKLLHQLSSDPDLNCDGVWPRLRDRRTQSESESSQANQSILYRIRNSVSESEPSFQRETVEAAQLTVSADDNINPSTSATSTDNIEKNEGSNPQQQEDESKSSQ